MISKAEKQKGLLARAVSWRTRRQNAVLRGGLGAVRQLHTLLAAFTYRAGFLPQTGAENPRDKTSKIHVQVFCGVE